MTTADLRMLIGICHCNDQGTHHEENLGNMERNEARLGGEETAEGPMTADNPEEI